MATFTFVPQYDDLPPARGDEFTRDLPASADALAHGQAWFGGLNALIRKAGLAIARGEGTDLDWLGAYDWARGGEPAWSPED